MGVLQSIYNKLNSKPKTDLKTHAVKLSELSDIESLFRQDEENVNNATVRLETKVNEAWSAAQELSEYNLNNDTLNRLYALEDKFNELMGEAPEEIKTIATEMELFYAETSKLGEDSEKVLGDLYDKI